MKHPIWIPCEGEAHYNGHQDACGLCAPYWGRVPICRDCYHRLDVKKKCRNCGLRYTIQEDQDEWREDDRA